MRIIEFMNRFWLLVFKYNWKTTSIKEKVEKLSFLEDLKINKRKFDENFINIAPSIRINKKKLSDVNFYAN